MFSNLLCYITCYYYFFYLSYIISFLFLIPFSFSFISLPFSFYRTLYNLYLNPILLKILSNYTYTIPKVITLHIYILTSCLTFFIHFYLSFMHFHLTFLLFLHIVLLCLN